jgi:hypothetical protein
LVSACDGSAAGGRALQGRCIPGAGRRQARVAGERHVDRKEVPEILDEKFLAKLK